MMGATDRDGPATQREAALAWFFLLIAGLFEIGWAAAIKQSDGFTRLGPTVAMLVTMVISITLLAMAMRVLPLGTAYATFTGIGVVGAFLVGVLFLGEAVTVTRVAAAVLIVAGLILMKLSDSS